VVGRLSLNESIPAADPQKVGVKVTATVQLAAAATGFEVEHVVPELEIAKGPVTPIARSVRSALPVFVSVTVWILLVVPTN
jgi:hypothetical protein